MSEERTLKIGEVMRLTGISRQTVHNYTVMRLIRAVGRTRGNHRLYPGDVLRRLARIQELKKTRSLREVRRALEAEEGRAT